VNGKSQGLLKKAASGMERYRLMWNDVVYEPGTLTVVAYDAQGLKMAAETVKTAAQAQRIELSADRTTLHANGEDLAFVTVSVVDKNGIPCPTAANQLSFRVEGKGTFRAACNGDPTSLELFHVPTMRLFSGKLVVLVQSLEQPGPIRLRVTGEGLTPSTLVLNSL
jgi:beta-galactosidase